MTPTAPTDPYERISRIRFLMPQISRVRHKALDSPFAVLRGRFVDTVARRLAPAVFPVRAPVTRDLPSLLAGFRSGPISLLSAVL
jgi:hypothetical protein